MRGQEHIVKLKREEREELTGLTRRGKTSARIQTRARILLHADTSKAGSKWTDEQIAQAVGCCPALCGWVRRRYATEGIEAVLTRKKRATPPVPPIFDGEKEARLIRLACSPPPPGQAGWTLRMLAHKAVELRIVDQTSHNTVGLVLKKTNSSRTLKNNGLSRRKPTPRS